MDKNAKSNSKNKATIVAMVRNGRYGYGIKNIQLCQNPHKKRPHDLFNRVDVSYKKV